MAGQLNRTAPTGLDGIGHQDVILRLGGLAVWLDAADESTFSYSSGNVVSEWRDKSGNGLHFNPHQNNPAYSPLRTGGRVVFDGIDDAMDAGDAGDLGVDDHTVFVVCKPNVLQTNAGIYGKSQASSTDGRWGIAESNNKYVYIFDQGASGAVFAVGLGLATTDTKLFTARGRRSTAPDLYEFSIDGAVVESVTASPSLLDMQTTGLLWLGVYGSSNGQQPNADWHFNGAICEVLDFRRDLDDTETSWVHAYLSAKWGVPLA